MTQRIVDYRAGERLIRRIELSDITVSHNPRCPAKFLAIVAADLEYKSILEMARDLGLSDDADQRAEFVALVDANDEPDPENSIVDLAASRLDTEIQSIVVRDFRKVDKEATAAVRDTDPSAPKVYVTHFGIVSGERRVLAAIYNFAKGVGKSNIGADVRKLTLEEAEDIAWAENLKRKQMTALEIGRGIRRYRERPNPETSRNYTLKEIAHKLFGHSSADYQFCVSRFDLTYLTDGEQARLEAGKLGVTEAARVGKLRKNGQDPSPARQKKDQRNKMITLKACQELFDRTPRSHRGYLQALADVMQIGEPNENGRHDLDSALEESEERREAAEIREAQRAERSRASAA